MPQQQIQPNLLPLPSQYSKQKLNESTADFNNEIRNINQELREEGKLDPESGEIVTPRNDCAVADDSILH